MAICPSAFKKVEYSAVTSIPHEHVAFNWNVQNFKALLDTAIVGHGGHVSRLPFTLRETLFPPGDPITTMSWAIKVEYKYDDDDSDSDDESEEEDWKAQAKKAIAVYLMREDPLFGLTTKLYAQCSVSVYKDKEFTELLLKKEMKRLCPRYGTPHHLQRFWGTDLFDLLEVSDYLDEEGSLNLKVTADFYVNSDGTTDVLPLTGEEISFSDVEGLKTRKEMILDQVASLLGDEVTSDVIVSVVNKEHDLEIGKFFCHSAILSGRSSILKEMLEGSKEKKEDKVILKLKEDVTLEVIDLFLTFLYSGKLKDNPDKDEEETSMEPTSVTLLPQLVDLAHKYQVDDLTDLCDVHLHRVVRRDNVRHILTLAKRHNLKRTLAKLERKLSEDSELLHAVYR